MIYSSNVKQRPMIAKESMNPLGVLQKLAPPQAIIHIGAGDGYGEMHQWRQWGVSHAFIIDANKDRLEWARPLIAKNPGWHAASAVLFENEGEVDYYQASNPEEDGLIPPQRLSSLWPNLQATDQSVRSSRRLDHLLDEEIGGAFGQADSIWVLVDCLPALPILRGAGTHIEQWSVLKLRVLLHFADEIEEDASLQSIEAYLQPLGFQCIEITESNHPAIGYALFARNWKTILHSRTETLGKANAILTDEVLALVRQQEALNQDVAALNKAYEEQEALVDLHLGQIESLTQERNSYASQAAERQAQIDTLGQTITALNADMDALVQERSASAAQYEALKQEVAVLCKARDEQSALANQRQEQIEALTQTNVDLKSDKEAIIKEKSALAVQYDTLKQEMAVLSMAHYEQSALASQHQEQIKALAQECDHHTNQAVKLQAQIDALAQANTALKAEKQTFIQEKSALTNQHDALKQEMASLRKGRDEQNTLANQRQAQIEAVSKERDSHASQAVKLQAQIDTLIQTNTDLKANKEVIAKEKSVLATQHEALKQEMEVLGKARDEQSALANQRKALIEVLTMPKTDHHLEPYVLTLNNYDPFTTVGGGATRLQGLYAAIAEWSNVVVMCFYGGTSIEVADIGERIKCIRIPKTLEHLKEEKYFNSRFHIPTNDIVDLRNAGRNPVLNDVYDVLRKRASIVVCDHIYMMPLPRHFGDRFVYSSHNFEYKLKKELLKEHPNKEELIKEVYNAERFCVTTSDLIVAVSAEDSENFTRNFNITAPIIVVPNGASVPVAPNRDDVDAVKGKINSRSVVFLGSAHRPNVEAAKFIIESLASNCPNIEFHLVGSVCLALPSELPANVRTWGVLNESMKSAVLQHCKVAINPMFSGGGSNVKLADFLMNGLYVVSTSFGVRGYPDLISAHVTIANQDSFAEVLQNVLDDPGISNKPIRMERQSLFIEHLSMRSLAKQFVDVLCNFDQPKSSQIEALTQERNNYANQAAEWQAQIEILTQVNITLKTDKEAFSKEKSDLIAQYDSLEQKVAKLNKSYEEKSTLAQHRLEQIDTLTQTQAEQTRMVTQYKAELEQIQLKLQQSSARIIQLESELAESDARQHLINEEMIKAEAQIELIKDVLLREPGL
ncbi:glycosyltransferase family 4 protein [Nitrosomonas communis]|uniref:Uncharacterized protein n=1 Tax=Nitrosomonas communis TaxID=44574 RepID=A0A1H2Q988_9PROT|nr:glycosyltransferase family 4 protein [Nitrosomonas communis]SDW03753.1 hypothetical protein SAMN05421882_100212 [Nitrosomonas communis]